MDQRPTQQQNAPVQTGAHRQELKIIEAALRAVLDAGYTVSVNDGEQIVLKDSTNLRTITRSLGSTDHDVLILNNGEHQPHILLVYGNEPFEVIADYALSIEHLLQAANQLAQSFEARS